MSRALSSADSVFPVSKTRTYVTICFILSYTQFITFLTPTRADTAGPQSLAEMKKSYFMPKKMETVSQDQDWIRKGNTVQPEISFACGSADQQESRKPLLGIHLDMSRAPCWGFPGDSDSKELPEMLEHWVRSLNQEDPWRREWLPTPGFLPGEFMNRRACRLLSMGSQRVRHDWGTNTLTFRAPCYKGEKKNVKHKEITGIL